ncbi:MAG: Carboxypeptidase regulatory-like domain-containing protein [Chloroflexi bacterium]|nr:MAG: Carboxypeptidase regulatory-like domain-containing protein [Chloroflexota bacterium]
MAWSGPGGEPVAADVPNNARESFSPVIEDDVAFSPSSLIFHVELPADSTNTETLSLQSKATLSATTTTGQVSTTGSQEAPAVRLKSRSFTPKSGVYVEHFTAAVVDEGQRKHVLLQLSAPLTSETRTVLERQGVLLLDYVPDQAYFASVPAALTAGSQRLPDAIHWLGPIEPADRVARQVSDGQAGDWAIANDGRWLLEITLFDDVPLSDSISMLEQAGVEVLEASSALKSATVAASADAVSLLSAIDAVQWIDQIPPPRESLNENARRVTGAEVVHAVPYDLDGSGVAVAIWELDNIAPHPDFAERLIYGESDRSFGTHPTHVAGTVGGDGDDRYRGIAPGATLLAYDILNSSGGGDSFATLINEYGVAIGTHDAVASNNSWGSVVGSSNCSAFGNYSSDSSFFDGIVEGDAGGPITVVFAAGNSRNDNICGMQSSPLYTNYGTILPGGQTAKNTITVGATVSSPAPNEDTMTTFSSWGPTDDGRIKPEIVAPGQVLFSTKGSPGSFSYGGLSGTSMASPTVVGGVALLTQRLRQVNLPDRRPDLIKALLVQSARDGLPGANHPDRVGPDYIYGYGRMDLVRAIGLIDGGNLDLGSVSAALGEHERTVYVPNGATTLKATLTWIDPPAASNALTALVNDLDLEIWGPAGSPCQPCYPWTLDPASPSFDAVRDKANHVDNLEQVLVDGNGLVAGLYTVRVNPAASGSQDFSLVWSVEFNQEVQVVNNGGALDTLTVSAENGSSWLSAGALPWTVDAVSFEMLTITIDPAGLAAGTYQDNLLVTLVDSFAVTGQVSLPVTLEVTQEQVIGADFTLTPASGQVNAGSEIEVVVTVGASPDANVEGALVHLDFDPALLKVVSISDGGALNVVFTNTFDNAAGTLGFEAGTLASPRSAPFTLATITFQALAGAGGTTGLVYSTNDPRITRAVLGELDVTGNLNAASIEIIPFGTVEGTVRLERRSSHGGVNVHLGNAGLSVTVFTDSTGSFSVHDVPADTYTVTATTVGFLKGEAPVVVIGGNTSAVSLFLLAGDVDSDDQIGLLDLIYIVERLGTATTSADLNRDGIVDIRDMVLVAKNFGAAFGP